LGIVSLGIVFFEIGVFELAFVKCRVTSYTHCISSNSLPICLCWFCIRNWNCVETSTFAFIQFKRKKFA